MRIQDAFSNCCEGIKEFAFSAASWIGKTVTATGSFLVEGTHKVAEFVKPHFENLKTFAQENKESLVIATVACTIGAILTAIISNVFYRGTNTTPTSSSTSAATP
jgi:hypothetical protein